MFYQRKTYEKEIFEEFEACGKNYYRQQRNTDIPKASVSIKKVSSNKNKKNLGKNSLYPQQNQNFMENNEKLFESKQKISSTLLIAQKFASGYTFESIEQLGNNFHTQQNRFYNRKRTFNNNSYYQAKSVISSSIPILFKNSVLRKKILIRTQADDYVIDQNRFDKNKNILKNKLKINHSFKNNMHNQRNLRRCSHNQQKKRQKKFQFDNQGRVSDSSHAFRNKQL